MKTTVMLTYFKKSGKYYSEGEYVSEKEHVFEMFQEVREKVKARTLPGLILGAHDFHVLIEISESHAHAHPFLLIGE